MSFSKNNENPFNKLRIFFDSSQQISKHVDTHIISLPNDTVIETVDFLEKSNQDNLVIRETQKFNLNETYSIGAHVTVSKGTTSWTGEIINLTEKGVWIDGKNSGLLSEDKVPNTKIWISKPDTIVVGSSVKNRDKFAILSREKITKNVIFLRSNIKWNISYHFLLKNDKIMDVDEQIKIKTNIDESVTFDEIVFVPKSMLMNRSTSSRVNSLKAFAPESMNELDETIDSKEISFKLGTTTIKPESKNLIYKSKTSTFFDKQKQLYFVDLPTSDSSSKFVVSSKYGFRINNDLKNDKTFHSGKIYFYTSFMVESMQISGSGMMNKVRPGEKFDILINEFPRIYCKIDKQISSTREEIRSKTFNVKIIKLRLTLVNTTDEEKDVMLKYYIGNKKYDVDETSRMNNGYLEWFVQDLGAKKIVMNRVITIYEKFYENHY